MSHALGALIDAICDANRWSDEDVARRSRSRGHKLSKSNISRIRNEPVKSINAAQMHALADGLGLPIGQVLQAALRSMGLPSGDAPAGVEGAVKADPHLIPEARRHLLAQYQLLLRIAGDDPTPIRREKTPEDIAAEQAAVDAELLGQLRRGRRAPRKGGSERPR